MSWSLRLTASCSTCDVSRTEELLRYSLAHERTKASLLSDLSHLEAFARTYLLTSVGIRHTQNRMRTTLDIPTELMDEAIALLGFKSKTDAVIVALRELIRRKKLEELRALSGKLEIDVDRARSRRRPKVRSK